MVSRSIIAIVVVIVIIAVAGVYYISRSPAPTPQYSPPQSTTPTVAADGAALYKDNCEACHGAKGVGGKGPVLTASNVNRNTIEKGNIDKGMPAFGTTLTPDQITAILQYLTS